MGSKTPQKLPLIDFSKPAGLKPGSVEWNLAKGQVKKAIEEYGCFEASLANFPVELRAAIFEALEQFFDLPLQTKSIHKFSDMLTHGYIGNYPVIPWLESMFIADADIIEKVEAQTRTYWPHGNTSFSETIQSYAKNLSELDQMIRRMILESYDVEKYMDEHMDSTLYVLKIMKYKAPKTTETKLRLNSHTDTKILTILHSNEVEGLEVQTKDGEWIDVKPTKDSFIVIIGESLQAWLNGRVYPPYHRVMMCGNKVRYTAGLFTTPKAGYIIKAPEELVDEAHPLLFKPHDHFEFWKFYATEAGQKSATPFKEFCGV